MDRIRKVSIFLWVAVIGAGAFYALSRKPETAVAPVETKAPTAIPPAAVTARPKPTGHWEMYRHDPKDKEACLAEAGGTINEAFARCREGWIEEKWVVE